MPPSPAPVLVCLPCSEKGSTSLEWPFTGKREEWGYGWMISRVNISAINSSLHEQMLTPFVAVVHAIKFTFFVLCTSKCYASPKLSQLKYRWNAYILLRSSCLIEAQGVETKPLPPTPPHAESVIVSWLDLDVSPGDLLFAPCQQDLLGDFLQRLPVCLTCITNTSRELILIL